MKSKTITRIWHGTTKAKDADEYLKYLIKTGIENYKKTEGNLSVEILRRIEDDRCRFWAVTRWDSYENIKNLRRRLRKSAVLHRRREISIGI
jgi:heme-degrading monooxygenase HmoA